jgi:choline dehydrogenase
LIPVFRAAERWEGQENEVRGKDGPLHTSNMDGSPICAAVVESGKQPDYQEDINGITHGSIDTIGWCQQTRNGRRRASAARTYLARALSRPNLRLITNAMVHRVIFDGKRAVGVEFARGGATAHDSRARGDLVGGRDRLTAHPATLRCRRCPRSVKI